MKCAAIGRQFEHADRLALVNREFPLREPRPVLLAPVGLASDGTFMERRAAALLNKLMEDIGGWHRIAAVTGWRSMEEQQKIWDDSLAANGEAYTRQFVAFPGQSEHHTGLAVDLGLRQSNMDIVCPDFPYEGICQTFRSKAPQYGFIQRYPSGKEHITGIAHEPWHFRYVGIPHAELITMMGITLEEYLELLEGHAVGGKPFIFKSAQYEFELSYAASEQSLSGLLSGDSSVLVSEDGRGGYVVTAWKNREV